MLVKIRAALETFQSSLFFVPLLFLLGAVVLAQIMLAIDAAIDGENLPGFLRTTVGSARSLLSTIATATITVAGVAFSISVLVVQLASNQYSPRVLHNFFRDAFTKRVLGVVVGVFGYSLLLLRVVRGPLEENGGEDVIPYVSVLLALVLGVVAILAIVAFINHSAHSMSGAEIIRRITEEAHGQIRRVSPDAESDGEAAPGPQAPDPPEDALIVPAAVDGWIQQAEPHSLLEAVPPGGTVLLHAHPGRFVPEGLPLCTVWPVPEEESRRETARKEALEAIRQGPSRTMQEDLGFGIRQLVDVALRALSPSENDPTTAGEVVEHLASVLKDLLTCELPRRVVTDEEGRTLFRLDAPTHQDYVDVAFDQLRRAAAPHPAVVLEIFRAIGPVARFLDGAGLPHRAEMLREKAARFVEEVQRASVHPGDLEEVRSVAAQEDLLVPAGRPAGD